MSKMLFAKGVLCGVGVSAVYFILQARPVPSGGKRACAPQLMVYAAARRCQLTTSVASTYCSML
jgi:hypothetical protein